MSISPLIQEVVKEEDAYLKHWLQNQITGLTTILSQERAGYHVIITEIANDILNTIDVSLPQLTTLDS
jgi:delta-aminolevulinic acid dehydratase/porphobilinogen synthase